MNIKKIIFIICGLVCVVLGSLGIVVPGLPTTPFILLASWLFYRSSENLRKWLLQSRLGKYVKNYEENKGITKRGKFVAISLMLIMCTISSVFLIPVLWAKIIVAILGVVGAITVAFFVPTAKTRIFDE